MASRDLVVKFVGDTSSLDRAFGKTQNEAAKTGGHFDKVGKAAGVAGAVIGGALVTGLALSVKAAEAGQVSQAALDSALKSTHQSVQQMAPALQSAEDAARKMGFTDDEARAALSKLEIATGSTAKSTKELAIAEDIARFKHVSLEAATKMLTMAQTGSQRALKQLGLEVGATTHAQDKLRMAYKAQKAQIESHFPTMSKMTQAQKDQRQAELDAITVKNDDAKVTAKLADHQATAANVIAMVSDKLGGNAKAYADTAAGGMAQFHAQTQHLEETLGKMLLPALTQVATALASVTGWLAQHTTAAKVLITALGVLSALLLTVSIQAKAVAVYELVAAAATKAWTAAQWLLDAALSDNPIGVVVMAIAALIAGLILAWQHSATFRRIVTGAFNAVQAVASYAIDFIKNHWQLLLDILGGPIVIVIIQIIKHFGTLKRIGTEVFDALLHAINEVKSAFEDVINTVKSLIGWIGKIHIPHIPGFSSGGIVPGPRGAPMLAVVHGGETVTPAGHTGAAAIGGDSGITFNFYGDVLDGPKLVDLIEREFRRKKLRNGSFNLA